jgi:Concanavalin A-like lectin/glucanases superfamily
MIISNITIANIPYIVDVKPGLAGSLAFNGGSNGSGSYLSMSPGFTMGTGAYTIEGWIYLPNFTSAYGILGNFATPNGPMSLFVTNSTNFSTDSYGGGGSFSYTVPTMSANTWYYFALTRNASSQSTLFLGKTPGGAATRSSTGVVTDAINYNSGGGNILNIGTYYGQNWPAGGYMTNLRVVTGSNVYDPNSTSITVPDSALTAVTNTKYLMLGAVVTTDTAGVQTVTTHGTVTQTSAIKPF